MNQDHAVAVAADAVVAVGDDAIGGGTDDGALFGHDVGAVVAKVGARVSDEAEAAPEATVLDRPDEVVGRLVTARSVDPTLLRRGDQQAMTHRFRA